MAENLDLALGGFHSAGQALQPAVDRQQKSISDAQPLGDYEKALGLMLSGKLTPSQAAAHFHLGVPLDGPGPQQPPQSPPGGAPMGAPPPQPPPMLAAQQGPAQAPSYGYAPPPQAPASPQMSAPVGGGMQGMPPPQAPQDQSSYAPPPGAQVPDAFSRGPQTQGDMHALMNSAGLIRSLSTKSPEDRLAELELLEAGRYRRAAESNDTKRRGQDVRGNLAAAEMTRKSKQWDENLDYLDRALQARIEMSQRSETGKNRRSAAAGKDHKLEALKLMVSNLKSQRTNIVNALGSLGSAVDPNGAVATYGKTLMGGLDEQMNHVMDQVQNYGGLEDQQSDEETPGESGPGDEAELGTKPSTPLQAPINGGKVLPTNKNVQEPGRAVTTSKVKISGARGVLSGVPSGYKPTGEKAQPHQKDGSYSGGKYQVVNGIIYERI